MSVAPTAIELTGVPRTAIDHSGKICVVSGALKPLERLTLPEMIAKQAVLTPLAPAVVCGERVTTYRELENEVTALARELTDRGLAPNTRIAVLLDRSVDLVVALLAVLKAGSSYIPLDPAYPRARLAYVVKNSRPAAILTKSGLNDFSGERVEVICLDNRGALSAHEANEESAAGSDAKPLIAAPALDSVAYVIYTSGSTGVPKGVRISHRSVANFLCSMLREPGLSASDTVLSVTTVSFDIAVLELFLPLIAGAKVVLARESDVADGNALRELMSRHAVTLLQATPMTWRLLVDAGWQDSKLKMLCGGEALPRKLADQLLIRGGELWNMYGPTETTVWSSVLRVREDEGPVLLGPPIDNTEFFVLNEHMQPVAADEPGELYIGGAGVALGYVDLPQLTAGKFVPQRLLAGIENSTADDPEARVYRTGDIVRRRVLDGVNCLEFLGRVDHQVKIRGYRIEIGEIEATLLKHPAITHAVAITGQNEAGPNEDTEPVLWAYVQTQSQAKSLSSEQRAELQALLNKHLPTYMHPAAIVALARFPQTENGKIDRKALPPPPAPTESLGLQHAAPQDVEGRLADIWRSLLNVRDLDSNANFFLLGGQSLLAMQLLECIEHAFGVRLTIAVLFGAPTLGQQAQLLQRWDDAQFDFRKVVQLHASGPNIPIIAVHNTGIYCYHLAQLLGPLQPLTALQLFDPSSHGLPTSIETIAAEYVALIRKYHPTGPYRLMGWCIGGVLAFEIACQLREQGADVMFVGMIDAWAPGNLRRMPRLRAWLADRSYRTQLILTDWRKVQAGQQTVGGFLRSRVLIKRLLRIAESKHSQPLMKMFADRHLSGAHYDRWLGGYLDEVGSRYTPRQFDGRIALLRSSREPRGLFLDPWMGWKEFAAGGIDTAVIEGDHFTVFRGAGLQQLATLLSAALARNSKK